MEQEKIDVEPAILGMFNAIGSLFKGLTEE